MIYLTSILVYLGVLVILAAILSRRVRNQDDFMVAGRKLGTGVLVGTLLATWMGSGSLLGAAGLAYREGFAALWFSAGAWIGIGLLYFVAARARRLALFTVPDLLELRYHVAARVLGTITTVVAYTAITSYQFRAGGAVLAMTTGLDAEAGMIITALFVITFTALAGMLSVAYTDLVNGAVMTGGMVIVFPILLSKAGGWSGVVASLPASHFSLFGNLTWVEAIAYMLPAMLLLLGEANMYQRFFSARSESTARRAVAFWIVGLVGIELVLACTAIVGSALYPELGDPSAAAAGALPIGVKNASETILLYSIRHGLPVALGCLLLAAAVSMIVSTADSFLLVPSTNLARDVYQRFLRPRATPREILIVSRVLVVLLGLAAYVQLRFFSGILEAAMYAYTMYGAGLTPAILAAFFWKRATPAGGVASIAGGMLVTLGWELGGGTAIGPTVYPALATSVVLLFGVSLLGRPPSRDRWRRFFEEPTAGGA